MKERGIIMQGHSVRAIAAGRKTQTRRVVDLARLRVRLPRAIESEFNEMAPDHRLLHLHATAPAGTYAARLNPQGAVIIDVHGKGFGVKPDEFDLVCPYADGKTELIRPNGPWQIAAAPEQRLWVREAWNVRGLAWGMKPSEAARIAAPDAWRYAADDTTGWQHGWRTPLYMPRAASRLTLLVSRVRLQRLHAITEDDAAEEGAEEWRPCKPPRTGIRARVWGAWRMKCTRREYFEWAWDEINGKRAAWTTNPWVWAVSFSVVDSRRSS